MKNFILEAIEEGSKILNRDTDREYRVKVIDAMQLLLKALKKFEDK